MSSRKRKAPKRREALTEWMHLHCKAGPMRDRRMRRKRTRSTVDLAAMQD
jgi:hypothetical protein